MKFFLAFLCVILAVVTIAQANDCELDGHKFSVGETYSQPGKCRLYKCEGKNALSAKTCPDVQAPHCKKLPQDFSKPYPQCCPQFDC